MLVLNIAPGDYTVTASDTVGAHTFSPVPATVVADENALVSLHALD